MKNRRHAVQLRVITLVAALTFATFSRAATVAVSSCSQSEVQAAINSATEGDVVSVPAGNCSWSSLNLAKGIHLMGAGSGATKITVTGSLSMSKSSTRSVELSGFSFSRSGGGNSSRIMIVRGSWNAEPPLIHDNLFTVDGSGILRYETNGGVIYRNTFRGAWDDSALQHKDPNDAESWSSPDTMGVRDTTGKQNLYVEDNVFEGMANQATDFDDGARVVFRHNVLNHSSFNSHGLATSPVGVRHYEIYGNTFNYADTSVNQNWQIWLRGGTGVIFDNHVANLIGQMWGDKAELHLSVRSAVDGGVQGCCTSYPCPHQIGQNSDGQRQFTDPLLLWGNTGTVRDVLSDNWSNTCGQNMSDFLQEGRDFIFATTPKSGYSPYPYPHPLRAGTVRPAPPANVSAR